VHLFMHSRRVPAILTTPLQVLVERVLMKDVEIGTATLKLDQVGNEWFWLGRDYFKVQSRVQSCYIGECLLHVSTFATTRVALPTGVEPG
jgi:hypothetical protein